MLRFADESKTTIQSDDLPGVFIPVDERNVHYRELVMPRLVDGNAIADFVPDPAVKELNKKAHDRERMLDELLDGTKTLDEIRVEIKTDSVVRNQS